MSKISARLQTLLKSNPAFDPFTLEFRPKGLESAEEWNAEELVFINQISTFNDGFLFALKNLMTTLRHHGFTRSALIDALFAKGNKHIAFVRGQVHNQMNQNTQAVDYDRTRYFKVEDYKGNLQNSIQMVEFLSELYGLLLTYQDKYDILNQEHVPEEGKAIHDIDIVLQHLIQMVNIVFNLKIAYHLLVYAVVDADLTDPEHLKLSAEDNGVNLLTSINEIRSGSHFNEIFFPLYQLAKSFPKTGPAIENISVQMGQIAITVGTVKLDKGNEAARIARTMAFYEYLEKVKLSAFGGVTIEKLLELTGHLSELTDHHFQPAITVDSEFDTIPYKIRRSDLISYLTKMSNLSVDILDTFITSMTNPPEDEVDFFRYPLYAIDEYIYLLFSALGAPHGHPLVERWLRASRISESQQQTSLCEYITSQLELLSKKKLPKGIKWHVQENPPGLHDNELCLETRDQLVIASCQVFRFTGNKKEEITVLADYQEKLAEFEQRLIGLQPYAQARNKRIVPVCVTSDVHYSGILLGNIPVLDFIALKNYLVVGKYQRVKMITDPKEIKIKNLYDYPYYSNQDEFETHLIIFLWKPYPIYALLKKMEFKEAPLLPPDVNFQISYHVVDMISVEDEEQDDLASLDHLIKTQLFINDNNPEYDQLIHNILSKTFATLADKQRNTSREILEFVDKISSSNRISATHLVIYLRRGVETLGHIKKVKKAAYSPTNYNAEGFLQLYSRILESHAGQGIQFSEFKINVELSEADRQQIIAAMLDQLSGVSQRNYNIDEQEQIMLNLSLLGSVAKNPDEFSLLYLAYGNFVESLNYNQDYQKARDCSYELWLYSLKKKHPANGLNILFKCFIKQKNFIYAGIYGGMLLATMDTISGMDESLFIDILFNLFRYFREFGYDDFAKTVWKIAQKERLNLYDDQKFTLAYFNLRVGNGLRNDQTLIPAVGKYLNKNLKSILKFGKHGAIPWFAFCANIQKHCELYQIKLPSYLEQTLATLESTINDKDVIDKLQMQINGKSKDFKKDFITMLVKVYSNLYYSDYKFNVINLRPIADNAFREGFMQQDFDLTMLCSLVYNDQQLNFTDHDPATETIRFDQEMSRLQPEILTNYSKYLLSKLQLAPGQVLIWLAEFNNQAYSITISADHIFEVKLLEEWDPKFMSYWIRNKLPKFYFNSIKSKYYDLGEQEQATAQLINSLAKFDLKINRKFEEIMILKSVDMSGYPDNLMINNGQLLSRNTPICNILNIEHYLQHQDKTFISFDKINAWLPKIGKDGTISFGHDDLSPLLAEFHATIIDEAVLFDMPSGNINIFMAHGNTGLDGFKSFQSEEDRFQFNFNMFGQGDIAILFICNSGNLRDDFQSQDIKSVGQELIKQGYRAVIAPFWKYDVTMSRIWLTEFFKVFQEGYSINQTVHLANRKVAEYDPETGRFFDEPGGWAAMHLYGNPNLYYSLNS